MKRLILIFSAVTLSVIYFSCANQIPPSGGEDDRIPPEIVSVIPKQGTVNFKGNNIVFRFSEYVDHRSFEESFYISPLPGKKMDFSWRGKEVEAEFSKALEKNRTYVVTIGKELKDIRGNSVTGQPYVYAFSTGPVLDKGKIEGKVYTKMNERLKIFAYFDQNEISDTLNPENSKPDFVTQTDEKGNYVFSNLPDGYFRLFAVTDDDRNNRFSKLTDKIFLTDSDIYLSPDSAEYSGADFMMIENFAGKNTKNIIKDLKPDSSGFIFSNITEDFSYIPPAYKFIFYFSNTAVSKSAIVNNISITDTADGKSYKLIYNWINDSLLEIIPQEKFSYSSVIKTVVDLSSTSAKTRYTRFLKIPGNNAFSGVSGRIISRDKIDFPVYVILTSTGNNFISYSQKIKDTLNFSFEKVIEGNYTLFSFIDKNDNGVFDEGNYSPVVYTEKFYLYDKEIKVKGGWDTGNIFIRY